MYQLSASEYSKIGAPQQVIEWIKEGVPLPFDQEPDNCFYRNRIFSDTQASFVDSEIQRLLLIKVIKLVTVKPKCVLSMRVVPKKNGKSRLVVDCRPINDCIHPLKFSQEGIAVVNNLIQPQDILFTVDVKDGFHHIRLNNEFTKYIGIYWRNQYFEWQVLCFGISVAPYYFNKVLCPVIVYMITNDECPIRLCPFVDDFLLMIQKSLAQKHLSFVLSTLRRLGWTPNEEKCDFSENTQATFVGFSINSDTPCGPWLRVLPNKIHKLRRSIVKILQAERVSARNLAKVAGQCIAMTKAIVPGKLLLCNIYHVITSRSSWDVDVIVSSSAIKDLKWWLQALKGWNGAPLASNNADLQIETDAASSGWGGLITSTTIQATGLWPPHTSNMHSNFRELLAVLKTLQSLGNYIAGRRVQILSDNVTTVAYINHLGGPSKELSNLMSTIWCTAQKIDVILMVWHLSGSKNVRADFLSRISSPYDWQLVPGTFKVLDHMWGPHTVDRFAAQHNTHLPVYNSLYHDPTTSGVNATAQQDWNLHNNFVNPPFWMISKVILVICKQKAHTTIIALYWPAQSWMAALQQLSVSPPLRISKKCCLRTSAIPEPLKNKRWKLYAWRICGSKNYSPLVGHEHQGSECCAHGCPQLWTLTINH